MFYEIQLATLVFICFLAVLLERLLLAKRDTAAVSTLESEDIVSRKAVSSLARKYLVVYAVVMGADWLQGPYIYSLYRQQYGFSEETVAVLFVAGFLTAGVAAPLVGVWADQHGRKRLCLAFCISYTLACICTATSSLTILLLGRLLGGASTAILFSVFESWLLSAGSAVGATHGDLSSIMGRATFLNGMVAAVAGLVSNELVRSTGSFVSPFAASGALLALAWVLIRVTWQENYGAGGGNLATADTLQLRRLREVWGIVGKDPQLLVLGLTQTCFEGSMYLFVFLWVPALQAVSPAPADLPLGLIFASYMISMMVGSLLYTISLSFASIAKADSPLMAHAKLSSLVCAFAASALAASVAYEDEHRRFWAFCVFEACVGMYFPVQGMLRGTMISNEHRATISSLFRIPLNVFVVLSLLTGVSSARSRVMTASALALTASSIMTGWVIVPRADEAQPLLQHSGISSGGP